MKVRLEVNINPIKKLPVDKSLKCAEMFIEQLLASDEAKRLAQECGVELPVYQPKGTILHRAFGFASRSDKSYTYVCWEQEVGKEARKIKDFPHLDPAATYNGDLARDWKASGKGEADKSEEQSGTHLLYRQGKLVKTLWIEACRL